MSLVFFPHTEDSNPNTLIERIEMLMEAADRYKATVLESVAKVQAGAQEVKCASPKDQAIAFNWEEIAIALRQARELPEGTKEARLEKSAYLVKLAEIYEVLRASRMSKLEAVRLALIAESNQLKGGETASTG